MRAGRPISWGGARFYFRYPQRGLVIVISDFLDDNDPEKPLQFLYDFGHELILAQVWAPEDREPPWDGELELEDAETGMHVELAFDPERGSSTRRRSTSTPRRAALRVTQSGPLRGDTRPTSL